jgi:predicted nucleic acid-binding protein
MLIVADTSPISYLLLIHQVEILPKLYGRIIVPPQVLAELRSDQGPPLVQGWAAQPPGWLEVKSPGSVDMSLPVDEGERAAIALAKELKADFLLVE